MNHKQQNTPPTKKERRVEIAVFSVLGALFLFTAAFLAGWFGRYSALGKDKRALLWAIDTAKDNYYKEITDDDLYGQIFDGFALDDYSCFYTASEFKRISDEKEGVSEGAGFSVYLDENKHIRVYSVAGNSPAQEAGLRDGMYLFAYGASAEELTKGTINEFVSWAGAQKGEFFLKCGLDENEETAKVYSLAMGTYTTTYCTYRDSESSFAFRGKTPKLTETNEPLAGLDGATAYLKLDQFNGGAAKEFKACLDKMAERGRSNLVLDLRLNGGGYMDILIEISSYLLKDVPKNASPVVAYAEFRNGEKISYAAAGSKYYDYFDEDSKITVLADSNTASASECLIGALIDYGTVGYGDIILRKDPVSGVARTYGKGIMQSYFNDKSGNVLKLTVAEIFWPNGHSIHDRGVIESDGAKAIEAPVLYDAQDTFLQEAIKLLPAGSGSGAGGDLV